jgi:hypothetical protein
MLQKIGARFVDEAVGEAGRIGGRFHILLSFDMLQQFGSANFTEAVQTSFDN